MTAPTLTAMMAQPISYDVNLKKEFLHAGYSALNGLAGLMGLDSSDFDLRINEGGIASSGDITLHGNELYVQISQRSPSTNILFRTCKSRKDFVGDSNNYATIDQLSPENIEQFAASLSAMVKRARLTRPPVVATAVSAEAPLQPSEDIIF
jgi:hypothetical protein